jgi:cell division protease FtsH
VDAEVRQIVEAAEADAMRILAEHRGVLDTIADALLERETLDEVDLYRIAGIERTQAPV